MMVIGNGCFLCDMSSMSMTVKTVLPYKAQKTLLELRHARASVARSTTNLSGSDVSAIAITTLFQVLHPKLTALAQ